MTRIQLLLIVLLLTLASGSYAAIPTLPNDTWVPVSPTYAGMPTGGTFIADGWNNKGVYDPVSQRTMIYDRIADPIHNGASPNYVHSIYANAVVAYDPATNVASILKINNWKATITPAGGYTTEPLPANATNPTPVDRHPLGSFALNPNTNTIYLTNGLNISVSTFGFNHPQDTWTFDLNANAWSQISNTTNLSPTPLQNQWGNGTIYVMTYDAFNDVVVYHQESGSGADGTNTWTLNPHTNHWTAVTQDPSARQVNVSASGIAYDPPRHRVLSFGGGAYFGDSSKTLWAYSVSSNLWTRLADCPVAANAPGFDYDSNHDVFIALFGTATWVYDPKTDAWSQLPVPFNHSLNGWQNITYNPAQDVFVYEGNGSPTWALFRYSGVASAPVITQQPVNMSVSAGQTATFTVLAAGSPPPTYQWQIQAPGTSAFSNIPGATASTYSVVAPQASQSGSHYRATAQNSQGTSAPSSAATLTITSVGTTTGSTTSGSSTAGSTTGSSSTGTTSTGSTTGGSTTTGSATGSSTTGSTSGGSTTGGATGDAGGTHRCGMGFGISALALALSVLKTHGKRQLGNPKSAS